MGSGNIPRVWIRYVDRYVDRYVSLKFPDRPCRVQVLRHSKVSPGYEVLAEFPESELPLAEAMVKLALSTFEE